MRVEPQRLKNPDLDIRYRLPELLVKAAGGLVEDNGYDYAKPAGGGPPALLLFLTTEAPEKASAMIRQLFASRKTLRGNPLKSSCIVAISTKPQPKHSSDFEVLHAPASWGNGAILE